MPPKRRWGNAENQLLCELFDDLTIDPTLVGDLEYLDSFHTAFELFSQHNLVRFRSNVQKKAQIYLTDKSIVTGKRSECWCLVLDARSNLLL